MHCVTEWIGNVSRRLETRRVLPINNPGEFSLKRSAIAACAAPTHVDPRLLRTIRKCRSLAPFIRLPGWPSRRSGRARCLVSRAGRSRDRTLEFCGLILAAILTAAFATQPSSTQDWATMPPSFVDRLHVAAAPRSARGDARRHRRDGDAGAHGFTARTSRPPHAHERRHRHGGDAGSGPGSPGARRHDGPFRVAGAGRADRGGRRRVLPRQVRPGGDRRAARHQTAGQSIVAEEPSPRLSELLHRRQPRGRARRGDRPPDLGAAAGGRRAAVFRLPRVLRAPQPPRRRAPPPGGHRRPSIRACPSSTATAGSRSGTTSSNGSWAVPASGRWAVRSPARCRPWPRPSCRERSTRR